MRVLIRALLATLVLVSALVAGVSTTKAQTLGASRCFFAQSHPENGHVIVTATPSDPLVLTVKWVTSQLGNMNKFLKSQQIQWSITRSDSSVVTDDITSYGDTRHWSTPIQETVNGALVWSSTFTEPTGVTLAGPPPTGGPGEAATLTFTYLTNAKVYDDNRAVYVPEPGTNILMDPTTGARSTATCTIEGR